MKLTAAYGCSNGGSLTDATPNRDKRHRRRGRNIQTRKSIHFNSLNKFFNDQKHFNVLKSIVNKTSLISLRLLEFVCTHVAQNGLLVTRSDGSKVYLDTYYQDCLDSQGKQFFDPFRRNPQSRFMFTKFGKTVDTNIAQMRFFRFAINFGVIKYTTDNFRGLEELMSGVTAKRKLVRKTNPTQARPTHKRKRGKPHVRITTVKLLFTPKSNRMKRVRL
jgi:hypothetical protein